MLSAVKSGSRLSGGQVGKGGKMMPQKATADGAADFKLYAVFGMEAPKELISRYTTYLFLSLIFFFFGGIRRKIVHGIGY